MDTILVSLLLPLAGFLRNKHMEYKYSKWRFWYVYDEVNIATTMVNI